MARIIVFFCIIIAATAWAQDDEIVVLESTVTGNQEQPNILYILPWKDAEDNTILDQSVSSRVEGVFSHVERAEHLRKLEFIEELDSKE